MGNPVSTVRALKAQGLERGPGAGFYGYRSGIVRRGGIMVHDQLAILGHAHVELDPVASRFERSLETGHGVLPCRHWEAPMTDQKRASEPDPGKNVRHEERLGI